MVKGSKYRCEHLKGETLKTIKKYSNRMYVLKSEETGRKHVAAEDLFQEPHLMLAHVSNINCHLTELKETR